jgi:hypothetical protein
MLVVAWGGAVMLVGSLVLAIVARRTVWGMKLVSKPPHAAATRPEGSVLLAAHDVRGFTNELVPLLADWQARGVLAVEQLGPFERGSSRTGAAWGPEWRFTVLDASGVDQVEFPLLRILVPEAPTPGATATLRRDDKEVRDKITEGVYEAIKVERDFFGPRPLTKPLLAIGLVALAVVGALASLVGAVVGGAGPYPIAWALLGGGGIGVVIAVCRGARSPSEGERRYRQAVLDLEAWVHSTPTPDPRLAGWAMVWGLPGAWEASVPDSIASLRGRDRAFLRGDFAARRIPKV